MHIFKRFNLLGSVILSLIIPLNKMKVPKQKIGTSEISSTNPENILSILPGDTQINYSPIETIIIKKAKGRGSMNWLLELESFTKEFLT